MTTTDNEKFVPLIARLRAGVKIEGRLAVPLAEFATDAVFVLSPRSALEVQRLAFKENATAEAEDLHLPYNSIVVEMPITKEIEKLRTDKYDDADAGANKIARVAAVIRRTTDSEGRTAVSFWPLWEFENGSIGCGVASFAFFSGGKDAPHNAIVEDPSGKQRKAWYSPSPAVLHQTVVYGVPKPLQANAANALLATVPHMVNECVTEIAPLLFAWEAVMNCKSGITRTAVNPLATRNGAVLGKKKQIMANTGYTVISLSAVETTSSAGVTGQRCDVEAHLVRGHFKRRRSGVYWWNPFIRGTGELRHRKAYIVEGEKDE